MNAISQLLLAAAAAYPGPGLLDRCETATPAVPCSLDVSYSPSAIAALIGKRPNLWWVAGDRLTYVARNRDGERPFLCCAIQSDLEPIGETDFSAITVQVPRMSEAILDIIDISEPASTGPTVIRGPEAAPAPPVAAPLEGKLIPFAFDSEALGETRAGTIYLPADIAEDAELPTIYLADGATSQFAPILEAAVRDGRAAPAIIVGIDSAKGSVPNCGKRICDRRNLDYIANQNPGESGPDPQFSRHLRFVVDELVPWVEATYPASPRRQDRIAAGFSSGAAWAFAAAALRPELFGNVLGMSSGSAATIPLAAKLGSARIYTGAGLFEPSFLSSTRKRAQLAEAAGADVRFRELVAGHSMATWDMLFAEGVAWLLPPRP